MQTRPVNISSTSRKSNSTRAALRKATLLPFVFVMYAYATGGPFGLEDMVTTSGPGLTLLYQLFIPFFWVHPRLARGRRTHHRDSRRGRLLPLGERGLRRLLGISGGLVELERVVFAGCRVRRVIHGLPHKLPFVLLYDSRLDALRHCRHGDCGDRVHQRARHPDGWHGRNHSGNFHSRPIVALCAIAAAKWQHNPFAPLIPPHVPPFQVFGVGLALGLWLYSGYEQVSSVAEEVENPQRNYPIALAIVVPLSMASYF